ncbi:hypothetical protein JXA56_04350 [Candidatus Micrarchaeota archaeon]|nr:hypothetical protein [Candidatus Micrarchaeota archaeon]
MNCCLRGYLRANNLLDSLPFMRERKLMRNWRSMASKQIMDYAKEFIGKNAIKTKLRNADPDCIRPCSKGSF